MSTRRLHSVAITILVERELSESSLGKIYNFYSLLTGSLSSWNNVAWVRGCVRVGADPRSFWYSTTYINKIGLLKIFTKMVLIVAPVVLKS